MAFGNIIKDCESAMAFRTSGFEAAMSEKDRRELYELATDWMSSIDEVRVWLAGRGHQASRSAVGRFIKRTREAAAFPTRAALGCSSDGACRRAIGRYVKQLSGVALTGVLEHAAFAAHAAANAGQPTRVTRSSRRYGTGLAGGQESPNPDGNGGGSKGV